jgi:phosphate transport system substrate-binding protein
MDLGQHAVTGKAWGVEGESVVHHLRRTPGGIAYCPLPFVGNEIRQIAVDGVSGTIATVRNGTYPLARPLSLADSACAANPLLAFASSGMVRCACGNGAELAGTERTTGMSAGRLFAMVASLLSCLLLWAMGQERPAGNVLAMAGSTDVAPVAKALMARYQRRHRDVDFEVGESGSGNGAKSLILGQCQIALMSRFMSKKEYAAAVEHGVLPTAHVVGLEGVAIVVHPDNPVRGLSTAQLRDIFAGTITNWQEVGGPDVDILVIARDTSCPGVETFEKLVMYDKGRRAHRPITNKAHILGSAESSVRLLQSIPNGIAYCSLPFANQKVKPVAVDGVSGTVASVRNGTYPISRPFFLFTDGFPAPGSHLWKFLAFRLTPEGEKVIEDMGLIPITRCGEVERVP